MKKVLIVEDEKKYRDILRKKLADEGYAVLEAKNGREALNIVHSEDVDLILLDLLMPEMDGFTFFHELKKTASKNIPTIILTNLNQASYQTDIAEFLIKANTSLDDLVEKVKKHAG